MFHIQAKLMTGLQHLLIKINPFGLESHTSQQFQPFPTTAAKINRGSAWMDF